jgi:hypothetical protein
LINEDKNLWQRPWYYMNLQADPKKRKWFNRIKCKSWRTSDGGKSFKKINVGHGDT